MTKIRELKSKFFEIDGPDGDIAYRIIDIMSAPCSADHFDEVLAHHVRQTIKDIESPAFIEWANEILTAVEANYGSDRDLRGIKKNQH